MGIDTDGILVFGIDFDEELPEAWQNVECFDFEDMVTDEANVPKLREDETEEEKHARWAAQIKAVDACPVELVYHCSEGLPMYILAIRGTRQVASLGHPEEILPHNLEVPQEKIDAMKKWMTEHDIEWQEPTWLLCSYWG